MMGGGTIECRREEDRPSLLDNLLCLLADSLGKLVVFDSDSSSPRSSTSKSSLGSLCERRKRTNVGRRSQRE